MTNETTPATAVQTQAVSQNATALKMFQEKTCTAVLDNINRLQESGQLVLPSGYHAGNALKSAWLYLQTIETRDKRKAIDVCTKESICNCLLQMATKGEYPMQHCYFIPTGNVLSYWERYTGKLMRAKRDADIESVNAQVVYEGDNFVYTVDDEGRYQLVKHETSLDNIGKPIKAAYAVVIFKNGSRHMEVMSMEQIRKAWMQGAAKGQSGAHTNFTDQMAKRTIISRACKIALDSSWDMGATEESGEDSMLPPSQTTAERDLANSIEHKEAPIAATGNTFNEPTDTEYEELGAHQQEEAPAQPERKCPI